MDALRNGLDPERADALLDEMMRLAGLRGHVSCSVIDDRLLRVASGEEILAETPITLVKSKIRSLGARLALRCQEVSGRDVSLYGDEVEIEHPDTKQPCKVRFENQPGSQRIEIECG